MAGDRPREVTEYPLTEAAEAAPVLTLSKRSVWRNRPLPPQLSHVDCQTDGTEEDRKDVFITKISAPGRPNI